MIGVFERYALFRQGIERAELDSKVGQEFAVAAEPTQQAAQLLDGGRGRHLRELA